MGSEDSVTTVAKIVLRRFYFLFLFLARQICQDAAIKGPGDTIK